MEKTLYFLLYFIGPLFVITFIIGLFFISGDAGVNSSQDPYDGSNRSAYP